MRTAVIVAAALLLAPVHASATTTNVRTVCAAGCDYATLTLWESGRNAALVDTIEKADCKNMEESGVTTTIAGWTTDATSLIWIKGWDGDRTATNTGVWSTERYRRINNAAFSWSIRMNNADVNVRIEDLQFALSGATAGSGLGHGSTGGVMTVVGNIFKGTDSTLSTVKGLSATGTGTLNLWNNVFYDFNNNGAGMGLYTQSIAALYAYNNTFVNCNQAITWSVAGAATNYHGKNNMAADCESASGCFFNTASIDQTWNTDSDYNTTDVVGEDLDGQVDNDKVGEATFVDKGGKNFHLGSADTFARNAGTSIAGTFTTDVDGDTRPLGSAWDIGADESPGGRRSAAPIIFQ